MSKDHPDWFRQRRYIHFDDPISFKKSLELVSDPEKVARHSFWPLITFDVVSEKIYKDNTEKEIKTKQKTRPISYAAHSDSQIYSYYSEIISKHYEEKLKENDLEDVVLAFRRLEKNNIRFANDAFNEIKNRGDCSVVALDITKFFDTLSHTHLKKSWAKLLNLKNLPNDHFSIFKSLTNFSTVHRESAFEAFSISNTNPRSGGRQRICNTLEFRKKVRDGNLITKNKSKKGIPQGTAISALLSNIYMLDFDATLKKFVSENGGRYMRYCDDMLFIMPKGQGQLVEKFAIDQIKNIDIEINPSKTDRCEFSTSSGEIKSNKPLQYLGFLFDGQKIIIRSAAFAKYSNKYKRGVSLAKQTMYRKNKIKSEQGSDETNLYKKKLLSRYSHLGKRNFIRYGHNAAKIMKSTAIKKQLRPLWGRLMNEIYS